jgi:hypothetical protein
MRWETQFGKILKVTDEDGIEGVVEAGAVVGLDGCGVAVDVILKVLTEESGAVPGQTAGARLEEEARAFDAAEREDVVVCVEDGFDTGEGSRADACGSFAFGNEFDCVGVEPEVDVGMGGEGVVVEAGEVGLGAPAREAGLEIGKLRGGQTKIAPDGVVTSFDVSEAFEVEGALVVRGEVLAGKGPAAAGNSGAWGEVEGVELEDLASPANGGAALGADAAGVDAAMGETGDLAVVEGLGGLFTDGAAAFEEQDLFTLAGELDGEGDAGGSRSGDADICDEAGGRRFVEEIVNHG